MRLYQKTAVISNVKTTAKPTPTPTPSHYTLGSTSAFAAKTKAVRYEINTLIANKYQWPLFVQAIAAMQAIYASSPDYSLGHYALVRFRPKPLSET